MSTQKYYTCTITLPNGKRKYIRGKTKKEMEQKRAEALKLLDQGVRLDDNITFAEYTDQWLQNVKAPRVKPRTVIGYTNLLRPAYEVIGRMRMQDIRASHIYAVMNTVDFCHGSQRAMLGLLRNVFNFAVDDCLIVKSPVPLTLKASGTSREEPEPITREQEQEMMDKLDGLVKDFAFVAIRTGMRRSEMLALQWADIDWKKQVIHMRHHVVDAPGNYGEIVSGAKTAAGVRDIPMPRSLMAYLSEMRNRSPVVSLFVFPTKTGGNFSNSSFSVKWNREVKDLSFPVHPHLLRHTYITRLFEAGLDIKQIQYVAGHATEQMTLHVYTHYNAAERAEETINAVQQAIG